MSSASPLSPDASRPTPRLGILVDCNSFTAKVPKAVSPPRPNKPAAASAPVVPPAKDLRVKAAVLWSGFRRSPLAVPVLALLFLFCVTAVSLHAMLASPVHEDGLAALQHQPDPARPAGIAKAQPAVKTPAKKVVASAAAPVKMPVPPAPAKQPGPDDLSPLALDGAFPADVVPAKELAKTPLQNLPATVDEVCQPSGEFCGTAVTFLATPRLAAAQALKQQKLLFVLHVSGNFEDPGFT
jgi:hypothetical protein